MPYCLAFIKATTLSMKVIELFTEMMYVIDIIIQFFIPVFQDKLQDQYYFNFKDIGINYL